jgi:Mrp family chromosome partitioning ATPase
MIQAHPLFRADGMAASDGVARTRDEIVELDHDPAPVVPIERTPAMAKPTPKRGNVIEYDLLLGRLLRQIDDSASAGFVGFTACRRRSGVSTIAANVAIRAADSRSGTVLLVDANTAHPSQGRNFGVCVGPGLTEVLGSKITLDDVVTPTHVEGLSMLGPGEGNRGVSLATMRDSVEAIVQEFRERYSLVVFDLPSGDSLSNWSPLVQCLDALLLVIASEETTQDDIRRIQNQCLVDRVTLTGSVLNRHRRYLPRFLRRRHD